MAMELATGCPQRTSLVLHSCMWAACPQLPRAQNWPGEGCVLGLHDWSLEGPDIGTQGSEAMGEPSPASGSASRHASAAMPSDSAGQSRLPAFLFLRQACRGRERGSRVTPIQRCLTCPIADALAAGCARARVCVRTYVGGGVTLCAEQLL